MNGINPHGWPILEFDPEKRAVIEPSRIHRPKDVPEHCVFCFFQEAVERARSEQQAPARATMLWEDGPRHVYELNVDGRRVALAHPGVGGPVAAGILEYMIALGSRKFIACGGAGVLDREIAVGHLLVPRSAVRDEGTSYHYLPPSREVEASPQGVAAIEQVLTAHGVEYLACKTWTTDAPYRETPALVARRREEGCLAVEMEAASFFAVAKFRAVTFAQILYGGDDVSGMDWDQRGWQTRADIRERLLWLAVEACLLL